MADIDKKLQIAQEKEYQKLLKENADIQERINNGVNIQARTHEKFVKNSERIAEIDKNRLAIEEKRKKAQDANFKRLTESAKVTAAVNKEEKKSRDLAKNMVKVLKSQKGQLLENMGVIKGQTSIEAKALRDRTLAEIRSGKLSSKEVAEKKRFLKVLNATGDLEKDILDDFEADTLENMTAEEARQKVLEKAGITQEDFLKMSADQKAIINSQIADMIKGVDILTEDGFKEMYDEVSEIESTFGPMIEKTKKWGKILQNEKLRMTAIKGVALGVAGAIAKDMFNAAVEVRQELGLGVGQAAALGMKITAAEKVTKLLGGRAGEVQNFATGIAREFGNVEEISTGVAMQFAKISATTGITGDAASKLAKSIQIIQGGSLETSLNMIEVFEATARTAGVMPKLVLEDIANSTETFAKFAKDGGKNIAAAAAQAAKLGLNLDTVAGIAESLLDFESSIEKQLEAQVLLGRSLNLDKARELSLAGDLEGLQKEIVKQVGSQAEFEAMNVVERKALADAIGTSVADLGKMVAGEKTSAQLEKEKAEAQHASMLNQEAMMKLMLVGQGISAAMLVIDQARAVLAHTRFGLAVKENLAAKKGLASSIGQAVAEAFKSGSKIPFLLGIPLAIGAIALLYNSLSKAKGFAKGGDAVKGGGSIAPSDTIPAMLSPGEVVLNAGQQRNVANAIQATGTTDMSGMESKMDAQVRESKEMNQNTKKLLEQNQFLMNKLIKSNQNLALSNN